MIENNLCQNYNSLRAAFALMDPCPTIIAVSKKQPIESIEKLIQKGQIHFAESYIQEAIDKITALPTSIIWHFIGPIQSNKINKIAAYFDWVQSLDNQRHIDRLNHACQKQNRLMNICLQVNIDQDPNKSGIQDFSSLRLLSQHIQQNCPALQFKGIMGLTRYYPNAEQSYQSFMKLQQFHCRLEYELNCLLPVLSMGMSRDYHYAIKAGSTMVRLGRCLFPNGAR